MDFSVGKVLVRHAALDKRLARLLRKKQEQKGALCERPVFESMVKPSDACGSSRQEKNRVTFFCRQHITGFFDPDEKSFLNQVQHTIGPRQTGDCLCKGSRVSFNIGPKPLSSPPPLNVMSQGLL